MPNDLSKLFTAGPISAETAAFNDRLAAELAELPPIYKFPPEVVRQARLEGKGSLPLGGPLEGSEWVDIPGAAGGPGRVRVTEPEGDPVGVYLHIHGGGWTIGAPDQYDKGCQRIAKATGMRAVSIQYRLAPEHPWPAQKEDCLAAARWVLAETDLPVVIGGESAGGHLSAVTALALREEGLLDRIKGLVLNYGVFDLRGTPSVHNWGERNLILSTPVMDWFFDHVDPDKTARKGADLSPILADLSGLPPALFQVGTEDPLLDDTLFMAARWQAAGNRTELVVHPGGIHGYLEFDELTITEQSKRATEEFAIGCL